MAVRLPLSARTELGTFGPPCPSTPVPRSAQWRPEGGIMMSLKLQMVLGIVVIAGVLLVWRIIAQLMVLYFDGRLLT